MTVFIPAQPAASTTVRKITVLYDANCGFCRWVRDWLSGQPKLVAIDLVPAGSTQARRSFPYLDHRRTLREVTAVADGGQVYVGARAWIVVLWALARYRPLALRLATPSMQPFARTAVAAAARFRAVTRDEMTGTLTHEGHGSCGDVCAA